MTTIILFMLFVLCQQGNFIRGTQIILREESRSIIMRTDRYTSHKGPWELVYKEEYASRSLAMKREKFLKSGKGREFLKTIIKDIWAE